jgi:RNA binding activity-knot of a chromodomain
MRVALAALALMLALLAGCKERYRIGDYVWVEWEGRDYPAYIVDKKGSARFRVHYDGYDARWDEDVTIERVKGRITGPVSPPPPPEKVARLAGPKGSGTPANAASFKVGDRVRVRWRGSLYTATIVAVVAPDKYLVHYEGYEAAWDETVNADRIAGR